MGGRFSVSRIRITGGQWRSRLIQVPERPGLRPTPDRVRETLFNWLGQDLSGQTCIDLFAGSGILGIEAASRGATRVVCVERDRPAFARLVAQIRTFEDPAAHAGEAPRIQAVCADALHFVPAMPADVLFLDPPYRLGLLERIVPRLSLLAAPDARLYVESEHAVDALGEWRTTRQGRAGQVFFHLLERP